MVTDGGGQPQTDFGSFAFNYTLDDLLHWAEGVLGSTVRWEDRSEEHTESLVLALVDDANERWFLKYPRDRSRFDREVAAFVTILPSFGDEVPRLAGYDDRLQCLLISAVPGRDARTSRLARDPVLHRAAGAWLARLHAVRAVEPDVAASGRWDLPNHLAALSERSQDVLSPTELDFFLRSTRLLLDLDEAQTVPCHGDFSPRNWLIDDHGVLRVIDFGLSGRDHAIRDLGRLGYTVWARKPALRDAFFDGYGRRLDRAEQKQLEGFVVLIAVQALVRDFNRSDHDGVRRRRRALTRLVAASA